MAGKNKKKKGNDSDGSITIARNRRARFDYFIEETIEAGIMLTGTEVKSCRAGQASLNESHAAFKNGELYLLNAHIAEYPQAHPKMQHHPRRERKLLLHRNQMQKMIGAVQRKGVTIVPVALYFNKRGIAKIAIGVGTGKKQHDKRETEKKRDWQKEKARIMSDKG